MSSEFTGVTFSEQKVTPSDDAVIRRAIMTDGILTGCNLSYSGSTLTMAPGALMICGRKINHPAAQNWAVAEATSGYARLLLTIDLTRTATKEAFDQVIASIEYASSVDGFVDLEQTDINGSGTRYQVVVCTVSLGIGGISGVFPFLGKSGVGRAFSVTVPAAGWYQYGAGYECEVSVPGLMTDDTPVVDLDLTGRDGSGDVETNIALCEEYGKLYRAISDDESLRVQATDIPGTDIPIKIKVVR